jgi:hypothetical protein
MSTAALTLSQSTSVTTLAMTLKDRSDLVFIVIAVMLSLSATVELVSGVPEMLGKLLGPQAALARVMA